MNVPAVSFSSMFACAALLVSVGLSATPVAFAPDASASYRTARGEMQLVQLPDGSRVQLAPLTDVSVSYADRLRVVTLLGGEAYFDVARDDSRPFEVRVGANVIQSGKTAFNVSDRPGESPEVLVAEGGVRVSRDTDEVLELSEDHALALESASGTPARSMKQREMRRRLAWRDGWIIAEDDTLSEIVSRMNLFGSHKVVIDDPDIRGLRLGGAFSAADPAPVVEAMRPLGIYGRVVMSCGVQEIHLSGMERTLTSRAELQGR